MDNSLKKRAKSRWARVHRVRNGLTSGTATKPRLSVSKTNLHLYVQLIDDEKGVTIGGIGTQSKVNKNLGKSKEAARAIGQQIAQIAKEKNINDVVFDRGRYKYHGILAQLADAAREAGLNF